MFRRTFLLVLLLLVVVTAITTTPKPCHAIQPLPSLRKLVVIHRHGARTGMGVVNGRISVNYPFCLLTDVGKEMCFQLGKYITQNYNKTFLRFANYNVSDMHTESTAVPRVVISAEAAIAGMFDFDPTALAFVNYKQGFEDIRLSMWTSWPSWKIRHTYVAEVHDDDAWVREYLGDDLLRKIGEYSGLDELCRTTPSDCVSFIQDQIAGNYSNFGKDSIPPWLFDRWDDFRAVFARFLSRLLGYDPVTSSYQRGTGSLGYPLANDIISSFFQDAVDGVTRAEGGRAGTTSQRLHHIAAHDWTLSALYAALGIFTPANRDDPDLVPRFAEALILELHEVEGKWYVAAQKGRPNQLYGTDYAYTFGESGAAMRCVDKAGHLYLSNRSNSFGVSNACLLDDLWRYVNSTAAQSPMGVCYTTNAILAKEGCLSDDAPKVDSRCYFYRKNCPNVPCGTIRYPNGTERDMSVDIESPVFASVLADPAAGYSCAHPTERTVSPFSVGTILAILLPATMLGTGLGFFLSKGFFARLEGSGDDEANVQSSAVGNQNNTPKRAEETSERREGDGAAPAYSSL